MRIRILPVIIFFLFALVVAKVFDLALEKGSLKIRGDIQAVAQSKDKTKDKKTEADSKDKKSDAAKTTDADTEKKGDTEKKKGDKKADSGKEPAKDPAKDAGGEAAQGVAQPGAPKSLDISDQVPMEKTLLENLAARRKELDDWAHSIEMKESVLNATEKKINSKMDELKKLETEVTALLAQYKSKEDEKNKKLVKIYEDMKPADAAKIFDTMDLNILLEIIGAMKEDNASKILAKMNTAKAKDLTTNLAQQKRLTTK